MTLIIGGTGTIAGLQVGGLTAGSVNAASLAASSVNTAILADSSISYSKMGFGGAIIALTIVRTNTRTSVSTAASATLFSGSFTKLRADSQLIATCTVYGAGGAYSGNCGVGMNIDGSTWDYGVAYQYDGAWNSSQTTIIVGQSRWSGISAGSHTIAFGWNTINNEVSNKPFSILNPNSSDDNRNQQMASSIFLYEVM